MDTSKLDRIRTERDRVRAEATKRRELRPALEAAKATAERGLGDALVAGRRGDVDTARDRLSKGEAELRENALALEGAGRADERVTAELRTEALGLLLSEHDQAAARRDELVKFTPGDVEAAGELREAAQQAMDLGGFLLDRAPAEAKVRLRLSRAFDIRGALGMSQAERIRDASMGIKPTYAKPWADVEALVMVEEREAEQRERQAHEARLSDPRALAREQARRIA